NFDLAKTKAKKEKYKRIFRLILKTKPDICINHYSLEILENFKHEKIGHNMYILELSSIGKQQQKLSPLMTLNKEIDVSNPKMGILREIFNILKSIENRLSLKSFFVDTFNF
ncbi:hypothetical protein ACFL5N_02555, partial [bacterium]